MIYQPSIRLRLTVWYTLALAAGLSLFATGIWFSMRASLFADLNATVADRAHSAAIFFVHEAIALPPANRNEELNEFAQGLPLGVAIEIFDPAGHPVYASPVRYRGRTYVETITAQNRVYRIRATGSTEAIAHTLDRLRLLLLASTPLVILIAAFGGYWLSRRALSPVDAITRAAQSIGIDSLSSRLTVPQTGDELQRLSETWNSMLARLQAAVSRLSQFTADASHELRTPLAVIRATAEIAARKPRTPASYRASLEEVVAESDRMTQLVDDLLFLARYDSGVVPHTTNTNLETIVQEACKAVTPLALARNIRLSVSTTPTHVDGNESALRRLALVLLDNAIKYSHPDSEVEIILANSLLAIRDHGIGISPEALPHIFERFFQADPARADRGYGLGLSQAQSIAHRHHATIEVASKPGGGSTFHVSFPPAHSLAATPTAERVARMAPQS